MQFQITESQQIVTWASLLLLPCLSKCCPTTNTELPPQQHESTTSSVCFYSKLHHQQLWIGKFILCMQEIHMKMMKLTYESLVL